jgi:hypothetical protein
MFVQEAGIHAKEFNVSEPRLHSEESTYHGNLKTSIMKSCVENKLKKQCVLNSEVKTML